MSVSRLACLVLMCIACATPISSSPPSTSAANDGTKVKEPTEKPFPAVPDEALARYTARFTATPPTLDGKPDEPFWQSATRTRRFVDLISGEPTRFDTRAAIAWDNENLYVAYWVEEPDVQAHYTKEDSPVYRGNNVECFIAGAHAYYEFEMNALGTIYDAFFIWQDAYESAGFAERPEFDFTRSEVRRHHFNGVGFKKHPRGLRYAFIPWDLPRVRRAVHIDGTLNDSSDVDRGWTVEVAFAWDELRRLTLGDDRSLPPSDGDVWRIDLSRFNKNRYHSETSRDSGGWCWNPHGAWDSHIPECFSYVTFSK